MSQQTGKSRSQRIEIDYYRRSTGLSRWRRGCVLFAVIVSIAYGVYVCAIASPRSQFSTGELASVHASFENDCQKCHKEFTPTSVDAKQLSLPFFGVGVQHSIDVTEAKCVACHVGIGFHYRDQMTSSGRAIDQNCSLCHQDHQGRTADLAAVSNEQCVTCHAKLREVCHRETTVSNSVVEFSKASHQGFQFSQVNDPGEIKFDHAQHLLPGQVDPDRRGAKTLSMIAEGVRERYRLPGQEDDAIVQLACDSCHQHAGQSNRSLDLELGRHMAPVNYEEHCAACHAILPLAASDSTPTIPHAISWGQVDVLLSAIADGQQALNRVRSLDDDSQLTAKLGEGNGVDRHRESDGLLKTRGPSTSPERLQSLRDAVRQQCLKCHSESAMKDETIASAVAGTLTPLIPTHWLEKGIYDHAAHREIKCTYCHADADPYLKYGKDLSSYRPQEPNDQDMVMIDGVETCTGCHRDAESETPDHLQIDHQLGRFGTMQTWATNDCILCHRYHTEPRPEGKPLAPMSLAPRSNMNVNGVRQSGVDR